MQLVADDPILLHIGKFTGPLKRWTDALRYLVKITGDLEPRVFVAKRPLAQVARVDGFSELPQVLADPSGHIFAIGAYVSE